MRALLDTHAFLWWIAADPRLSARAHDAIRNPNNVLLLSAVSGWEIAIKAKLGRLMLPEHPKRFLLEQVAANGIDVLPVQLAHALEVFELPELHRDPFDRLLIAQSKVEQLVIITGDAQFSSYGVRTIW